MRILFYGLQNSGATLITLFAGQRPDSLVVPDLWTMYPAPSSETGDDFCVKATVTSTFLLPQHLTSFQPDHVFLVIRRPVDNYASLRGKVFARHDGAPEEKFAIADSYFANPGPFTGVIAFEDFIADPSVVGDLLAGVGWGLPAKAADFPRTPLEMERRMWDRAPEMYERAQWGTGQARPQAISAITLGRVEDEDAERFCTDNCKHLHAYYEERRASDDSAKPAVLRHTAQDERALQRKEGFVSNQLSLFESHMQQGEAEPALELATELCALAPEMPRTWDAKARALDGCGRTAEVAAVLSEALSAAIEGSPHEVGLRIAIVSHELRSGNLECCRVLATDLAQRYPECTAAHQSLAEVALRQRRFEDAQKHALEVLMLEPRSVNGRRAYAEGLYGAGKLEEACDWLRSCLAIVPDFRLAQRLLARYSAD